MNLQTLVFYFFISLAAISALGILLSKNVFKSAVLLLVCLLSVAALYVLSFAEFLAAAQVMIYAGGVIIVIIFAVMLTAKTSDSAMKVSNGNIVSGVGLSAAMLFLLLHSLDTQTFGIASSVPSESITATGVALLTDFLLPFEISGILLLVVLIGAASLVSMNKPHK